MADIFWPSDLPQDVQSDGYQEQFPNLQKRTPMDSGPDKIRPKATTALRVFTVTIWGLTKDQVVSLRTFHRVTSASGTRWFAWKHPRTQAPVDMQFLGKPAFKPMGILYTATIQIQLLNPAPTGL